MTHQVVDLFHPRVQHWQEHFTWDERFERIIGLTATGRAPVEVWPLLRPELVKLRRWLYAAGEHPLVETADVPQGWRRAMLIGEHAAEPGGEEESQRPAEQPCMLARPDPISVVRPTTETDSDFIG